MSSKAVPRTPADLALREADVRRALVPIPVPVPPTNAWILGHGEVAMVDCGALYGEVKENIRAALAPGERVAKLYVTHGHPDHHGAGGWLEAEHRTEVFCHPFDERAVRGFGSTIEGRYKAWAKAALEHGAPEPLVARMGEHYARIAKMGGDIAGVAPLDEGAKVEAGDRTLEVLHVPGHTAGSIALLDRKRKVLFSGDTILPGITPNPFFEGISDHPSGPGPFLASLDRLRTLDVALVLPGHGEPLRNLTQVIDRYARHHEERRDAIAAALEAKQGATAFEVVQALFPNATHLDLWLAFAEVLGHLQYMMGRGRVERAGAKWVAAP